MRRLPGRSTHPPHRAQLINAFVYRLSKFRPVVERDCAAINFGEGPTIGWRLKRLARVFVGLRHAGPQFRPWYSRVGAQQVEQLGDIEWAPRVFYGRTGALGSGQGALNLDIGRPVLR